VIQICNGGFQEGFVGGVIGGFSVVRQTDDENIRSTKNREELTSLVVR
jgi:hypothetical protein